MREIRKRRAQSARCGHRLVGDRRGRQAHDVEARIARERIAGTAARTEQCALESGLVGLRARFDEHLRHARRMQTAERTAGRRIDGDLRQPATASPSSAIRRSSVAIAQLRCGRIAIEEDETGGKAFAERDARVARERAQPVVRAVEQDAAAVAGDAVRIDAAAMCHARECDEGLIDEPAARLVADLRDEPETAAVVFEGGVVQARRVATRHAAILAVPRADRSSAIARRVLGSAIRRARCKARRVDCHRISAGFGARRRRAGYRRGCVTCYSALAGYDVESNIDAAMRQITKLAVVADQSQKRSEQSIELSGHAAR